MLRVSDSAGPGSVWLYRAATRGAFPTVVRGRRPEGVISELNGWPTLPLSTLHVQSHDRPRMTRGHNGAAPPFMWETFTPCSMPVYPGAFATSPLLRPVAPSPLLAFLAVSFTVRNTRVQVRDVHNRVPILAQAFNNREIRAFVCEEVHTVASSIG
jgi:hypothetical protein